MKKTKTSQLAMVRNFTAGTFSLGFILLMLMLTQGGDALQEVKKNTVKMPKTTEQIKQHNELKLDSKQVTQPAAGTLTNKREKKPLIEKSTIKKVSEISSQVPVIDKTVKLRKAQTEDAWFDLMIKINE